MKPPPKRHEPQRRRFSARYVQTQTGGRLVVAFTIGGSLYFYTFTTYMQKYLVISAGSARNGEFHHDRGPGRLHALPATVWLAR